MDKKEMRLTELVSCGGCGAKIGMGELAETLRYFTADKLGVGKEGLLVGLQLPDDALVYQIDDERAFIQTVDFFPPIVDDPYSYGAIAAANAISDIYAMGGEVLWALNIVAFPKDLPLQMLSLILQGGADKIVEAGGFIGGGHSIRDDEPKFGMCVTGQVNPRQIWHKGGAKTGDALFLTKPLGTGLITQAAMQGAAHARHLDGAIASMMYLNRDAALCLRRFKPSAVTDVTGFGILGHMWEMAEQSGACFELRATNLPLLDGALEYARDGVRTGAHDRNESYLADKVRIDLSINDEIRAVLFDPQTSGGLLISIQKEQASQLSDYFSANKLPLWRIGEVRDGKGVVVIP